MISAAGLVRFAWFTLFLAFSLAGCADRPSGDRGSEPTSAPSSTDGPSGSEPDNRFPEPVQLGKFLATNCTSWLTTQFWPGPNPPPADPEPWRPSTPGVASMSMEGFDCKRISFAGLERGPIQMVLDYTGYFDAPEECRKTDRSTSNGLVYSWGVSDAGLVDALAERLGAPTYLIDYLHSTSPAPLGNVEEVAWGPPGQPSSSLNIVHPPGTQPIREGAYKFFWQNGTGVVALDMVHAGLQVQGGQQPVHGVLAPPMKLADSAYPAHVSQSDWFTEQSLDGTIYSWSDLECKQPSGSPPS